MRLAYISQNSCCVCLQEFPYTTDAIDSSLCNIPCSESPNVVLGECGGPKTYSIYKPGEVLNKSPKLGHIYMAGKLSKCLNNICHTGRK